MRVNELADRLAKEKPAESKFHTDFYANAWDPSKFGVPATEEKTTAMVQNAEETKEPAPQKEAAAEESAEKKP